MKLLFDALKGFQQDDTIIPGLVYFILQFTIQCHNQQRTTPDLLSNSSRYEEITQAFTNLLTHHFPNYRTVNFYADKLNITPRCCPSIIYPQGTIVSKKAAGYACLDELPADYHSVLEEALHTRMNTPSWANSSLKNIASLHPSWQRANRTIYLIEAYNTIYLAQQQS